MRPHQLRASAAQLVLHAGDLSSAAAEARSAFTAPGGGTVVQGGGLAGEVAAVLDALAGHSRTVEAQMHQMARELRRRAEEIEDREREAQQAAILRGTG